MVTIIGNGLMFLSLAVVLNRVLEYKLDYFKSISAWTLTTVIISIIVYAFIVIAMACAFVMLLKFINGAASTQIIPIYCKSNLYKYLPGNFLHYVGRNQIAFDEKIPHGSVALATFAEMVFVSIAAIILAVVFAGHFAVIWLQVRYSSIVSISILVLLLSMCLTLLILYRFKPSVKQWVAECINEIKILITVKLIMVYIVFFLVNGFMFLIILNNLGGEFNKNLIMPVIGLYAFSWVIGFITPGAPAGLGIREAMMSSLLTGIVSGTWL